jgi:hypothetical protein
MTDSIANLLLSSFSWHINGERGPTMPPEKKATTRHPVIAALEERQEDAVQFVGYSGTGTEGTIRLYPNLNVSSFVEIPGDAIISREDVPESTGMVRVLVTPTAEVREGTQRRVFAQSSVYRATSPSWLPPGLPPGEWTWTVIPPHDLGPLHPTISPRVCVQLCERQYRWMIDQCRMKRCSAIQREHDIADNADDMAHLELGDCLHRCYPDPHFNILPLYAEITAYTCPSETQITDDFCEQYT